MNTKNAVKDAYLKGVADGLCKNVEDLSDDADKAADKYVEQYVKETKMEEPKYKYVDAGIKTVGELVDRMISGEEIYHPNSKEIESIPPISFDRGSLNIESLSGRYSRDNLIQLIGKLVVRQPLPWYEVEGVFDAPKLCSCLGEDMPVFMFEYDDRGWLKDGKGNSWPIDSCTPLTPAQAAEYGVG